MKLWKEPFLHFALLGAAIFVWFSLANPEVATEADPDEIVVDQRLFETLSAQFSAKMNRSPLPEEAEAMVDRYVRDEIMVREALALGLDQGDGIVRNRLVQKMGFLTTSAAQSAVPDEATLEKHLQENADRFRSPASASFEQYGLAEGLDETTIKSVLDELRNGETPPATGRLQLLPEVIKTSDQRRVDGTFGSGFFAQVQELPPGEWAGPVQSGFGLHLVLLVELDPGGLPPLEEVRDNVLSDWRRTLGEELTKAQVAALMESYEVTRPSPEDLRSWVTQ